MVKGEAKHELEVNVPASQAWELYSTLRLAKLVEDKLSSIVSKIEVVHGDGGLGSIVHLFFVPGITITTLSNQYYSSPFHLVN